MTPNKLQVKKSSKSDIQLALLDERYNQMSEDISTLKTDTKEIKDTVSELKSSIDTLPEKLDQRYASKKTEDALTRLNWIVITSVVGGLLALIIKL